MDDHVYPLASHELSHRRHELAPETEKAFRAFSKQVFADGALTAKMKQIIAVAVAHVTQCPYCIRGHTKAALHAGARPEELMEAIWVAAEMRAGGAYAHATVALAAMAEVEELRIGPCASRRGGGESTERNGIERSVTDTADVPGAVVDVLAQDHVGPISGALAFASPELGHFASSAIQQVLDPDSTLIERAYCPSCA